jgi:hypothetical protein
VGLALVAATAIPVAAAMQSTPGEDVISPAPGPAPEVVRAEMRAASRSGRRVAMPVLAPPPTVVKATKPPAKLRPWWTTTRLNVRDRPGDNAKLLTVLDSGVKVLATGTARGGWAEIQHNDRTAWVKRTYLARTKPTPRATHRPTPATASATAHRRVAGVSGAACPDGSSVEIGLQPNTVRLYRAVCAAFPQVSAWGGLRGGGGNHAVGRALDIVSTGSLGDAVADYVRSNASRLGVSEVIWAQRIWTVQRSSEGWRPMEDRGSATANHYTHVHVSVY